MLRPCVKTFPNSVNINEPLAFFAFSKIFNRHFNQSYSPSYNDLVFLCIGTDRSTGDCLGPLVGHKLQRPMSRYKNVHVYGTLENPVHAKNLLEKIDHINDAHDKPFVIAIDACLSRLDRIGFVTVGQGPLEPGTGVNKKLPSVGDLHVMGIVNLKGFMEYVILQNTRLDLVMRMAETISEGIKFSLWKLGQKTK